jgi:hypothetical protein
MWFLIVESECGNAYAYRESPEHFAVAEKNRQMAGKTRRTPESFDKECWIASDNYVVVEMPGELHKESGE